MPWIFEKTLNFLEEDQIVAINAEHQFNEGIMKPRADHRLAIINERKRKEAAEQARLDAIDQARVEKIARKEDRRVKRRLKAIEEMIAKVKKDVIEKGDWKENVTSTELEQIHGNHRSNHPIVGAIGGSFMQIVQVVQAFFEAFALSQADGEENEKTVEKLRQFLTLDGLTTFLLNYLKEVKFDNINLQISPLLVQFLQELKLQ